MDRHGLRPRDDKVCGIVNTRGGDFRSATLYSSPPPAHPTMGFCEAKSFFDDAGPRRVSNLNFLRKIHSFNHSHEANTEAKVVVAVARGVVVGWVGLGLACVSVIVVSFTGIVVDVGLLLATTGGVDCTTRLCGISMR